MAATKKRNTLIAIIGAFVLLACAPQGEESVPRTSLTLDEVTVGELQEMMQAGDLSSVQLVDYYIDRIAQLDPQLNSILEINPDVHEIARALDAERLGGQIRSALHGIPVLLKDNIDTPTTCTQPPAAWHCWMRPHPPRMLFWSGVCERRVRLSSARPISANGRTFAPPVHPVAGLDAEGKLIIPTCWIVHPAVPVPARGSLSRLT